MLGSTTLTVTGTSSLEPSGYVTTTVASLSPGVAVSTGVLNSYVVPLGRSATLPIDFLASGVSPLLTFCSCATGVFLSASVGCLASTLISFQPTGLEYLPSTMFAIALALPSLTGSFISRTIVSVNPSVAYDFTTAFDSSFAYHGPSIESRLRATSPALLVSLFV